MAAFKLPVYPVTNVTVNDASKWNKNLAAIETGINDMQGPTGIQGPTGAYGGPPGATGIQGIKGMTGLANFTEGPVMPYVFTVPHLHHHTIDDIWYTYDVESLSWIDISSGAKGITGPIGFTGVQGVQGITGPGAGAQGETGLQGSIGATGIEGVTGFRGETGISSYTGVFNISFGGQYASINTTTLIDFTIPFNTKIYKWRVTATETGSISLGVWKDAYANFPPTSADAMHSGDTGPYLLSTDILKREVTASGWGAPTGAEGDVIRINVDQVSGIRQGSLALFYGRY